MLELNDGVFQVLATNGDTQLGGDDLDAAIAARFGITRAEAETIKSKFSETGELRPSCFRERCSNPSAVPSSSERGNIAFDRCKMPG